MAKYREVFQRKEIKYLLSQEQYNGLMSYLEKIAAVDAYGLSRINNIYFDTPDYQLIRISMEKPLYKEKLRLRTYGETGDDTNSFIEIKKKYDGIVYKRRVSGRYADAYRYLTGKQGALDRSQISGEIDSFLLFYGNLQPAMSICYDRIAMAGIEDPEFRVTFDSNIVWNDACTDLRTVSGGKPLLKPGQRLMEIKVCNAMPMELSAKLSELAIFPVSFSKYGSGYQEMMRTAGVRAGAAQRATERGRIRTPFGIKGGVAYVQ
ncbi:MAG: polyphosphate polymerase domain-containing protein [Lachnospiraceae bacterium]|nr:polyphosphate polymerase domain-containing protein [Lachnospiraceae bacterium]MBQ6442604.1 polyphosphate polymerase domain-containing protein [Lachnospiraceae bacterium]